VRGCQWFDIKMTPNNFLNECSYATQTEMYPLKTLVLMSRYS